VCLVLTVLGTLAAHRQAFFGGSGWPSESQQRQSASTDLQMEKRVWNIDPKLACSKDSSNKNAHSHLWPECDRYISSCGNRQRDVGY